MHESCLSLKSAQCTLVKMLKMMTKRKVMNSNGRAIIHKTIKCGQEINIC